MTIIFCICLGVVAMYAGLLFVLTRDNFFGSEEDSGGLPQFDLDIPMPKCKEPKEDKPNEKN